VGDYCCVPRACSFNCIPFKRSQVEEALNEKLALESSSMNAVLEASIQVPPVALQPAQFEWSCSIVSMARLFVMTCTQHHAIVPPYDHPRQAEATSRLSAMNRLREDMYRRLAALSAANVLGTSASESPLLLPTGTAVLPSAAPARNLTRMPAAGELPGLGPRDADGQSV
jgi:hypothetical protein